MPDETFLGDGLYAKLEHGAIALRAPRYNLTSDEMVDHFVYLEPEIYEALRKFARKIGFELPDEDPPE
jgi:hypothetical protein